MMQTLEQFVGGTFLRNESGAEVSAFCVQNASRAKNSASFLSLSTGSHSLWPVPSCMASEFPRFYTPNCARRLR